MPKNWSGENQQRLMISNFKLENSTIITPLLKFFPVLEFNVRKFIGSLSTDLGNVSTTLFNLLLILDEKETRSEIPKWNHITMENLLSYRICLPVNSSKISYNALINMLLDFSTVL